MLKGTRINGIGTVADYNPDRDIYLIYNEAGGVSEYASEAIKELSGLYGVKLPPERKATYPKLIFHGGSSWRDGPEPELKGKHYDKIILDDVYKLPLKADNDSAVDWFVSSKYVPQGSIYLMVANELKGKIVNINNDETIIVVKPTIQVVNPDDNGFKLLHRFEETEYVAQATNQAGYANTTAGTYKTVVKEHYVPMTFEDVDRLAAYVRKARSDAAKRKKQLAQEEIARREKKIANHVKRVRELKTAAR